MDDYFKIMTTDMKECEPTLNKMIQIEKDKGHLKTLKLAKEHIKQLIVKKEGLQKKCKANKMSIDQCWKEAHEMMAQCMQELGHAMAKH